MIGIDTFSWQKLIRLSEEGWDFIINQIIDQVNIFITVPGKKEFEYRFAEYLDILDRIIILPHLYSEHYHNYLKLFDETDVTLLEYAIVKGYSIITEDRPLLEEGAVKNRNIVQLLDFFYELYSKHDFFSQNEMIQLIKIFRKWRNIKKRKSKYYLKYI